MGLNKPLVSFEENKLRKNEASRVEWRALACAIYAGTGLGSVCMSPLIALLIDEFNYFGTMLVIGALLLNNAVGGALYRPPPVLPQVREDLAAEQEPAAAADTGTELARNVKVCSRHTK